MDRRRFLLTAATGSVLGGLAGCRGTIGDLGGTEPTSTATPTDVEAPSLAEQGQPSTICETDPVEHDIRAIDDPAFAPDWSGVEIPDKYGDGGRLGDDAVVIGVAEGGTARAYPVTVLWHHEVLNEVFPPAEEPLLVTFCSLCRSGMVSRRRVDGDPTTFAVTGQLWQPPEVYGRASEEDDRAFAVEADDPEPGPLRNTGNLVMVDEATGSYWSQLLAQAICGSETGERLPIVPSTTARLGEWRDDHPETDVLIPPPHSGLAETPV